MGGLMRRCVFKRMPASLLARGLDPACVGLTCGGCMDECVLYVFFKKMENYKR